MPIRSKLFFLAAVFLAIGAHAADNACSFGSQPTILESTDAGREPILLQYWDLDTDRILSLKSLPESKKLADYRESVEERIETEPMALLKRYIALKPAPKDLHNITVVTSRPENIKEMGCLEGLLLDIQIDRNQSFATGGPEFISFFLQKQGKLRVYFLTNDSGGIRGPGFARLLEKVDGDKNAGWTVLANLHNHSFFLNDLDSNKPQGVLAPSANDIRVFRSQIERFDLKGAYITNGFHTLYIPGTDMHLYAADE